MEGGVTSGVRDGRRCDQWSEGDGRRCDQWSEGMEGQWSEGMEGDVTSGVTGGWTEGRFVTAEGLQLYMAEMG